MALGSWLLADGIATFPLNPVQVSGIVSELDEGRLFSPLSCPLLCQQFLFLSLLSATISRLVFQQLSYSPTLPQGQDSGVKCLTGVSLYLRWCPADCCVRGVTIDTGNVCVTLRITGNPTKCLLKCTKLEFVTASEDGKAN